MGRTGGPDILRESISLRRARLRGTSFVEGCVPAQRARGIVLLGLRDQQPQATLDVLRCFLLNQDLTQLDHHSLWVITEDRVRIRNG